MSSTFDECNQIYHDSIYSFIRPNGQFFEFGIEPYSKEILDFFNQFNIQSWALVTAWNPFSKIETPLFNSNKNKELSNFLDKQGVQFYTANGRSLKDDWNEKGFFVVNITIEFALEIGTMFHQNAIVFGTINTLPKIVWTDDKDQ